MKAPHRSPLSLFALAAIIGSALLPHAPAARADEGSLGKGGGSDIAANFASVAIRLADAIEKLCPETPELLACVRFPEIRQAIGRMKVTDEDSILAGPDGNPRDAINDTHQAIVISKTSWLRMSSARDARERRLRLASHELFSISGLDSSDSYAASAPVVEHLMRDAALFTRVAGELLGSESSADCAREREEARKKVLEYPQGLQSYCVEKDAGGKLVKTKVLASGRLGESDLSDLIALFETDHRGHFVSMVAEEANGVKFTSLGFERATGAEARQLVVVPFDSWRTQSGKISVDKIYADDGWSPAFKGSAFIYEREVPATLYERSDR